MEFIKTAAVQVPKTIFTGRYHGLALVNLKNAVVQGFVASDCTTERFVDRVEALEIATTAKQTINKHNPKDILMSEDLFEDKIYKKFNPNLYKPEEDDQ